MTWRSKNRDTAVDVEDGRWREILSGEGVVTRG